MYSYSDKKIILEHVQEFGIKSAIHAFKVKKSSIYSWKKKMVENWNNTNCLKNKSTKPNKCRSRVGNWDYRIERFIQQKRFEHIGLSHEKVHILLLKQAQLEDWNCKLPSKQTVARIISDLKKNHQIPNFKPNLSFYANTSSFRVKTRKRNTKPRPKKKDWSKPGQRIQIDTVVLILTQGIRRYVIQATDVYSRISFSYAYKTPSSRSASDFFNRLRQVMPFIDELTEIQTDNGSEFLGEFKQFLETQNIKQLWNYPRSPKMNAYIERFNRTAQEEFIYQHQHLIRDNLQEFNQKLMRWLIWYNTERPHFSLDLKSPLEFLISSNQFSKMWWVGTKV